MSKNSNKGNPLTTIDRGVREDECAEITAISRTYRWKLENKGCFPKRRRVGRNHYWLLSELMEWLKKPESYQTALEK